MMQKLVVAVLVLTVVGAVGIGVYDAMNGGAQPKDSYVLAQSEADGATVALAANNTNAEVAAAQGPNWQPTVTPDTTQADAATLAGAGDGTGPVQQQQNNFVNTVGDPWSVVGTITALEVSGITVQLADGSTIFVELGPSHFWQEQPVTLAAGDIITITGFFNGENYHAAVVAKTDGAQLVVRSPEGQPLWSGGSSGQGNNGNGTEAQVAPEDWVTVEGTVTALNGSILTVQTTDGQLLDTQLGQTGFIAEQNISFAVGDAVRVLGLWQGTQFRAGEVTKLATSERLMLLDPNGRPLWAGPGRNGAGGNGNGGQGQGQGGQGQGVQTQANLGIQVPAAQWAPITGRITLVEPLAVTLQLSSGEMVRINLGPVDFWTEQGIWFPLQETLTVTGYWLNGQFEAGVVTFGSTGFALTIRDEFGQPVVPYVAGGQGQGQGQRGQGQGNGYRGGRE